MTTHTVQPHTVQPHTVTTHTVQPHSGAVETRPVVLSTAASPTPTALSIPPTPTALAVEQRQLLFSGDVLSHKPVIASAQRFGDDAAWPYDYRPMFRELRSRLHAADLAICVLETPVSADNTGLDGYPTFNAPRELPAALVDAGYDGCATASNHSWDRGSAGVRATLDQMDAAGLAHAGMARTQAEADTPQLYDLAGVVVAHLSYTYSLNGFVLPPDAPWMVNLNDVDAIRAEASAAESAGADLVVLSIQWGNEYQRTPSQQQLDLAEAITTETGVDLIIGNHAHVVQPIDWVNDVPVVYGLGNSLSNQFDNASRTGTQDGLMVEVTITGNRDLGWSVESLAQVPTWVDRSDHTIIDVVAAQAAFDATDPRQDELEASRARTAEAVALLGRDIPLAD